MEQVLNIKVCNNIVMKVHPDFYKWCREIQKENPELTLIKITKLIVKHNLSQVIRGGLINYEK